MSLIQDESDVWLSLRDTIQTWMTEQGYGSNNVYIVEAAIDESISSYVVQIVPVTDTAKHPISGVGLLEASFEVVIWWRGLFDSVNRATELIAGKYGAEQFLGALRQVLIQNSLDNQLTIPVLFISGGNFVAVPELDGWMRASDNYTMAYEINWG